MTIRIGLNGVGRIGRNLWRIIHTSVPDVDVVVANDTADLDTVAHLLRYDSIRGPFPGEVRAGRGAIRVDDTTVALTHLPRPDQLDWRSYDVDLAIEATGQFTRGDSARGHLIAGAPLVVISTASPDADVSLMMGLNEHDFDPGQHRVVSNSCCTTYCMATMLSPLHQAYGVGKASASIAYSHGSRPGPLLDGVHHNLRMARANATNLVPANVPGVRHALDRVLPELAGQVAATAIRVPVTAVSAATLTLRLQAPANADDINHTLTQASLSILKDYLAVSHAPLVSTDLLGSTASCVVDAELTTVLDDLVRVVGWYDNEWGYAHRLIDLARFLTCQTGG
ncbi:aldehyde dehydrogenase [Natronosporangium hydrolyticum]|uniref:Aldehyde dehydrogenase n=1 Tax=Natronosporangium hydrolyticum TaxID=2811111 RepID=A0A895YHS7_9ACTN|nr:type I glyceraldehyde-3-phosphate dehydrogenase [Natronosporangium hydrolyticum]QSB13288.1 aldehyde dehydrogenase [Natronosporangium hydrolyticum]